MQVHAASHRASRVTPPSCLLEKIMLKILNKSQVQPADSEKQTFYPFLGYKNLERPLAEFQDPTCGRL